MTETDLPSDRTEPVDATKKLLDLFQEFLGETRQRTNDRRGGC